MVGLLDTCPQIPTDIAGSVQKTTSAQSCDVGWVFYVNGRFGVVGDNTMNVQIDVPLSDRLVELSHHTHHELGKRIKYEDE